MPIAIAASAGGRLHGVSHRLALALLGSTTTRRAKRREVRSFPSRIVSKQIDVSKKASASI